MRRLLLVLALLVAPATLTAQADSTKAALIMADSKNAHEMATVALEALGCLLEAQVPPAACMKQFEPRYLFLGAEHQRIHKALRELEAIKRS